LNDKIYELVRSFSFLSFFPRLFFPLPRLTFIPVIPCLFFVGSSRPDQVPVGSGRWERKGGGDVTRRWRSLDSLQCTRAVGEARRIASLAGCAKQKVQSLRVVEKTTKVAFLAFFCACSVLVLVCGFALSSS
jgi:hypothetical protein